MIRERQGGYALVSDSKVERKLYVGDKLKTLKEKFHSSDISETISGTVASKGSAEGRAVIVKDRSELRKVGQGDILITPLTTPDLIMAMKKAAAIVTDLGGMTSHAAIVARELKKPCIIGTKIATQVLHDGDLVEVDAEKGVVRVLKRAGEKG